MDIRADWPSSDCVILQIEHGRVELDMFLADEFAHAILEQIESRLSDRLNIIFNMSCISYIDSRGIHALFEIFKHVKQAGSKMIFCGAGKEIVRVLAIVGLLKMIPFCKSITEALDHLD